MQRNRRIYYAGDSTVQYNDCTTYPQTGIGQVLPLFIKPEIEVKNHAKNGRSTKSFMDEGRLAMIYDEIEANDILLVQFAHNDEKIQDPTRYAAPDGEFIDNLERFANCARNKGALPVFITPIERRGALNEDGTLNDGAHGPYVEGIIEAGKRFNVPVIDVYTRSRQLLKDLGIEGSKKLHMLLAEGEYPNYPQGNNDNTHLQYAGAYEYASMVAEGLWNLGGTYREVVLENVFGKDGFGGFKNGETLEA